MKVSVGTITSSPGPIPRAIKARCNAVVPLEQDSAWFTSQYSAKAVSNCSIYLPVEEIQVDSRQSRTYAFSLPAKAAAATGINCLPIMLDPPYYFASHAASSESEANDPLPSEEPGPCDDRQP